MEEASDHKSNQGNLGGRSQGLELREYMLKRKGGKEGKEGWAHLWEVERSLQMSYYHRHC